MKDSTNNGCMPAHGGDAHLRASWLKCLSQLLQREHPEHLKGRGWAQCLCFWAVSLPTSLCYEDTHTGVLSKFHPNILCLLLVTDLSALTQYLRKATWRREDLFWLPVWATSQPWPKGVESWNARQLVPLYPQSGNKERWLLMLSLWSPFIQSLNLSTKFCGPTSINSVLKLPHRHSQRFVSQVTLDPDKLSMLTLTHVMSHQIVEIHSLTHCSLYSGLK